MTSKRPSRFILALGTLGLIEIPLTVNCWYCNRDTQLAKDSGETERCWHCNICGNTNLRDENGEIIDYLPAMQNPSLNSTVKAVGTENNDPLIPSPSDIICQDCQKNQMMIYKIMSDYIPDESDPNYDYYLDTANDYKRSLEEKYPMCDKCKSIVDNAIAKQLEILQQKQLGDFVLRQMKESQETTSQVETMQRRRFKTPRKLSNREDRWCRNLWILMHGTVLLFCIHAYLFPRPASESKTVEEDVIDLRKSLDDMLTSLADQRHNRPWSLILFGGLISVLLKIGSSVQLWLCMMACFTREDNGYCEKDYSQGLLALLLFWALSFLWMDWHFLGSGTNSALCQIKGLRLYKAVQRVLYIGRIGILFALRYCDTQSPSWMMAEILAGYFILLVTSVFMVKIMPNMPSIRKRGNTRARREPYWLGSSTSETKISQELLEAAQDSKYKRSTKMLMEEAAQYDEAYCEALKSVNKIRAKHGIEPIPIPVKPSWLSKDGGVGDISTGIDDLSFELQP